jgi:hypothetical protein
MAHDRDGCNPPGRRPTLARRASDADNGRALQPSRSREADQAGPIDRRNHVVTFGTFLALCVFAPAGDADAAAVVRPPAVEVRVAGLDRQLETILALFDGAKAAHPAAALASWRAATGSHDVPSKAAQALIALLNPEMARELKALNDAEAVIRVVPGGVSWWAVFPRDDGTLAALGPALGLTEGQRLAAPEGLVALDRLGPPGAALLGRATQGGLVLGSSPEALDQARERLDLADRRPDLADGWHAWFDPSGLDPEADDLPSRRLAAAMDALGCLGVEANAAARGDALAIDLTGRFTTAPPAVSRAIEPSWLDAAGAEGAVAAVALAFDPDPKAWDRAFLLADRIEKADPSAAKAAPVRVRLNLAATLAGLRPEVDLWPHLKGVTLVMMARPAAPAPGRFDPLLVLHADADASAVRIARLVARLGLPDPAVRGASVIAGPGGGGPSRDAVLAAIERGDGAAWGAIRASLPESGAGRLPQRAGIAWPSRWAGPDATAWASAPPLVWFGRTGLDGLCDDHLVWAGLGKAIREALDRLPLAEPARGGR